MNVLMFEYCIIRCYVAVLVISSSRRDTTDLQARSTSKRARSINRISQLEILKLIYFQLLGNCELIINMQCYKYLWIHALVVNH